MNRQIIPMGTVTPRKMRDGTTRFRAQVRIKKGGKVIHSESETFSKRTMAEAWIARREQAMATQAGLEAAMHAGLTVGDVLRRYREEVAEGGGFGRTKREHLKQLEGMELATLQAVPLSTPQVLGHLQRRRAEGAGPATVGNDLVWLRAAFKYGRRAWGVPLPVEVIQDSAETARAARVIGRSRRRNRRPTPEELELLDAYFRRRPPREGRSPPMRLVMWFAIYSCRRQDEQTAILRADLHRESGTYQVRDLKHPDGSAGNDHVARLPALGWQVVDAILRDVDSEDGRLLPFNPRSVSAAWARACKVLGIEDLRFHDLRHEGASRLAEDGATIPEIQQVTLHESWSSLQIYVNLRGRRQRRVDFAP